MEKPFENDPDTNVEGEEEKVVFPKTDDEAPAAFASPNLKDKPFLQRDVWDTDS